MSLVPRKLVLHPGEYLAEELKALRMSAAELSRQLKVPVNRITGILNAQRAINDIRSKTSHRTTNQEQPPSAQGVQARGQKLLSRRAGCSKLQCETIPSLSFCLCTLLRTALPIN